ncbi:MAG: c-type cytochrome [Acidobacteriaceae bacterium]|nr:c-type cytochrome [Acidobacteriaceae bacterium]
MVVRSNSVLFLMVFATGCAPLLAQQPAPGNSAKPKLQTFAPGLVEQGQTLFLQNCAFCHGRDAGGGETGPDLTRSKLVADDVAGDKIGAVVRNGRPEKGMPRFSLPENDINALVAFIHTAKNKADTQTGGRRGVDVADLQTGNAAQGKEYFAQHCTSCHSATGDLAGVATRYQGLKLEQRLLYPHNAEANVAVTLRSGQTVSGKLIYLDEFTIGLRDASGWYHSWPAAQVKYKVDDPAEAHVTLLGEYSDADIHNLMAFLQTLHSQTPAQ